MKICLALSTILPFAHSFFSFKSAKQANPCGFLYDGGEGFGRIHMVTYSAKCRTKSSMSLECDYVIPSNGGSRTSAWICPSSEPDCADHNIAPPQVPDAGCFKFFTPQGVKGEAKVNGHACSAGVSFQFPIYVASSISANNHQFDNGLRSCQVVKSGTANSIYTSSPCSKTTTTLKLAAKQTYQACIDVTASLLKTSVAFSWHLDSTGIRSRELDGKSLAEMITVHGNSTANNNAFRIVVGGEEVRLGTGD